MGASSSSILGSSPSQNVREPCLLSLVPELKKRGFNLLAIDFDKTIVDVHTGGMAALSGYDANKLARHVRPVFAQLLKLAPKHGMQAAVATFSGEIELIRQVLIIALGAETAEKILICGADGSWDAKTVTTRVVANLLPPACDWAGQMVQPQKFGQNKNPWLCSLWESMLQQQQHCGPGRTILIDDDANNIRACREVGAAGLWYNPSGGERSEESLISGLAKLAKTRRLLFLDVDGVLNSQRSRKLGRDAVSAGHNVIWDAPEHNMLENLRWIVEQTQVEIVVSSTWRTEDTKHRLLKDALSEHGMQTVGATLDLSETMRHDRPDEIHAWICQHGLVPYKAPGCKHAHEVYQQHNRSDRLTVPTGSEVHVAWIALDDMDLTLMNPSRMPERNFVRTDDRVGLVPQKALEAVNKLLLRAVDELPRLPNGTV